MKANRPARLDALHRAIATIEIQELYEVRPELTVEVLQDCGAKTGFSGGAYTLSYCGVRASCTASPGKPLLRAWHGAAKRQIERLQGGAAQELGA